MKSWTLVLVVAGIFSCSHDSAAAEPRLMAIEEDAAVSPPPPPPAQEQEAPAPPVKGEPVVRKAPEEVQQLVAPIALYPDELVAQILAASTYPTEVVQADRWLQQHPGLKGAPLAEAVDSQPWDDSVKAVAQFPSVLGNMDTNLSWTSALGDAYVNQPQDVMAAVQVMRRRAQDAGNLKTTAQQDGLHPARDDRDRARKARSRLCARVRSVGGVRSAADRLAGLVLVSGPVRRRSRNRVRDRIRHRLLEWIRLGLAPLGSRLAPPQRLVPPSPMGLAQPDLHRSRPFLSRRSRLPWEARLPWELRLPW